MNINIQQYPDPMYSDDHYPDSNNSPDQLNYLWTDH